ncbi:MAG TPA: MarR family transcriptional regulator [Acidimicrobiales bacterium]|nr:MarR family transcriptional regulator [Acidimicrobiales bacterium]
MADDKVRWLDEREQRDWRAVVSMQNRLFAQLARELAAASDLSSQDYAVLVELTDRPDGRLRLYELARNLGWERSRMSHHTSRMATRGLLTKETCDTDRRGAVIVVSPKGRAAIEAAAPCHVASVRRLVVDLLTPRQLDAVGAAARTVLAGLDAEEQE